MPKNISNQKVASNALSEIEIGETQLLDRIKQARVSGGHYHRLVCDNLSREIGLTKAERLYAMIRLFTMYQRDKGIQKQISPEQVKKRSYEMSKIISTQLIELFDYFIVSKNDICMLMDDIKEKKSEKTNCLLEKELVA